MEAQEGFALPTETIIPMSTTPTKFGYGATQELGYELNRLGIRQVILVSDKQLVATGLLVKIEKILADAGVDFEPYYDVGVEPTDLSFREAISFLSGKRVDGFIAVGGGSVIDTAKAMNLYSTYPADLLEYINPPIGKGTPVPGPLKPLIAVPTTAGTGSEATTVIVLDLLDMHVKTGISHFHIRPTMAIIDPLNTLTMPPMVTASSGMDVLTHAIESFTAVPYNSRFKPESPDKRPPYIGSNPIADLWSRKAIELGGKYLRRAMISPCDLDARYHMMAASTFAGIGFGNAGVHLPHALGYPIAGMVKDYYPPDYNASEPMVPHGVSVTITAPACFRFTAPAQRERHIEAAAALGYNINGIPLKEAGDCLAQALIDMMKDIGFPNGLSALGYEEKDIPGLVEGGWKQQRLLTISPRSSKPEDLMEIFRQSLKNW
ncbi:hydroxyacid-oxoacid transhydrogenase [Desulfopila sp. IMCC35008]|uniref:hydroxyacid-oxoacid transhydrogenase n=1 Tax=Desulfopila sp. IMCC35008 TaxID=2653858 RepID=UPI00197A776E|nr:hydroxyacid-oxoacid transhydrogenase [Desulfopila sp. IMCC35008]